MSAYVEHKTLLDEHTDSVNALSFSLCGRYLASGSSDRSICIWKVTTGRFIFRVVFDSQVNALLWHPVTRDTLICGCEDGTVFYLSDFSPVRPNTSIISLWSYSNARSISKTGFAGKEVRLGVKDTPVFCIDLEPNAKLLAIGVRNEVHITQDGCLRKTPPAAIRCGLMDLQYCSSASYTATTKLPRPQYKPQIDDGDFRIHPRSVHFYERGKRLIVSYLNHGVM